MSLKYKDFYNIKFTLTTGRVIQRVGNQSDLDMIYSDWPSTDTDALMDFKFTHPETLPFTIKRSMIETIESYRIVDWGSVA